MPISSGLNHVAFLTSDMQKTVAFYEAAFEAVVTFEMEKTDDHPRMKILDVGGNAAINVFEVAAEEIIGDRRRQGARGAVDHFAFAVSDLEVLRAMPTRLRAAGALEVGEPRQLGHEWSVFFRDPDGLDLEVCCPA